MSKQGAYGNYIGRHFGVPDPSAFVMQTRGEATLAVTHLHGDHTDCGMASEPVRGERAFVVALQLRELPSHELWLNRRPLPVTALPKDAITAVDLELEPAWKLKSPFDFLHFYMSRSALEEVADTAAQRIDSLSISPCEAQFDPVVHRLGNCLVAGLQRPERESRLFAEQVVLALTIHIAHLYGGIGFSQRTIRGGLAPWQERRAKELLAADLRGDLSMAGLAAECSLSLRHFTRAFRQSTGQSPHRWRLDHRLGLAKKMLLDAGRPLADIAIACGFADQSHFTRTFSQSVGIGPGGWRRAHCSQ